MKPAFLGVCCYFFTLTGLGQVTVKDLDSCSRNAAYFNTLVRGNGLTLTGMDTDPLFNKPLELFAKDTTYRLERSIDTVYFTKKKIQYIIYRHGYSFNDRSLFELLQKQVIALKYQQTSKHTWRGYEFTGFRYGPLVMDFRVNDSSHRYAFTVIAHASPK